MRHILIALLCAAAAAPVGAHLSPTSEAPITRQEALERADRLFDRLDVDRDGRLTRSEVLLEGPRLRAERAASGIDVAPGIGGHTLRYMKRRFAGASSITREQFERAMLAHFAAMDRDHDGVLTAEERAEGSEGAPLGGYEHS